MAPMKLMALPEVMEIVFTQAGMRVENTVADIDGPHHEPGENRSPHRQVNLGDPREGQRPSDGDRGCVEADKVPMIEQGAWSGEFAGFCWSEDGSCGGGLDEGKRHFFDFSGKGTAGKVDS